MNEHYCIVVDGYSSGNLIAPELKCLGFKCVHVQSSPKILDVFAGSFHRNDYEANIVFDGDFVKLVEELKRFKSVCVIPGAEIGVELSDRLCDALKTFGNDPKTSELRRNKYLMHQRLSEKGVPSIKQFLTEDYSQAVKWVNEECEWPVVVKPVNSAGTDSVFICNSKMEMERAFKKIFGASNKLGIPNQNVLVQEFLQGTEYVVDTLSSNGEHFVTDMWRYHKKSLDGRSFMYDCEELSYPEEQIRKQLQRYIFDVLSALEFRFGPSHCELILTKKGPILVETGARLNGGGAPVLISECTGRSLVSDMLDSYLAPERLKASLKEHRDLKKTGLYVHFISEEEGVLESLPMLDQIKQLKSFYRVKMNINPGDRIVKTCDLFTHPGHVELVHKDPKVLWNDYQFIRDVERSGFFQLSN